jgi:hypothetical protein
MQVRRQRRLVLAIDAGKIAELATACFGTEALGVTPLALLKQSIEKNLPEFTFVKAGACQFPFCAKRANERDRHDESGVHGKAGHLGDAADVLDPIHFSKAEVAVQPVALLIAVEKVGVLSEGEELSPAGWRSSTCRGRTGR